MGEAPVVQQLSSSFGMLDFLILALGVAGLLVIAFWTGRKEGSTADFFLGKRSIPAFVACLAFVATEISAVTILSVPGTGYAKNLQYLQFFIGSAAARIFIAFIFIPVFYRSNCTTIYEYLRDRFGSATQYAGTVFFFITRLLGSGVRLFAACLGISIIFGLDRLDNVAPLHVPGFAEPVHVAWGLLIAIAIFTVVSTVYIGFGGIKAVLWTGAYQTIVFYVAGIAVAIFIFLNLQGGPGDWWKTAGEGGRLALFNTRLSLSDSNTLIAAVLCAFFMNLTVFGTDQDFMQRLLVVKTRRASQFTLIGTIVAALPLTVTYLGLGTLLYVYYQQNPALAPNVKPDMILSNFVVTVLPIGLKGLVAIAVILASIDSPLVSLSTSFVTDIYRPLIRKTASDRHYLVVSRVAVAIFGLILAVIAYSLRSAGDSVLWVAFEIFGITGGSILGVFLLGILTKRRSNIANVVVMTFVALLMGTLLLLINGVKVPLAWHYLAHDKPLALDWTWLIVIGTFLSFGLSWLLGPVMDREKPLPDQAH